MCILWLLHQTLPYLSLSLQASLFPETQHIKFNPVKNPIVPYKSLGESNSHIFFILNLNLEKMMLNEEGILKAKKGWKCSWKN